MNADLWTITHVAVVHKHNLTFRATTHISLSVSPKTRLCPELVIDPVFINLSTMMYRHIHAFVLPIM
jgi:hypothetical protein